MRAVEENNVYVEPSELKKLLHHFDETESGLGPQLGPAIDRWRTAAAELENLLSDESKTVDEARETLTGMQDRVEARAEKLAALASLLCGQGSSPKSESEVATQRKLDVSIRELATLSRLLKTAEDNLSWLGDVHYALMSSPRWWRFMPKRWQHRKRAERVRRKGLFDAKAYLKRYPDIAKEGIDPLHHYIQHGRAEGRLR